MMSFFGSGGKKSGVIIVELSPEKLVPVLIGPGGAIAALLLFIAYLMREVTSARKDRDRYMGKYEDMREQRDQFRFLTGDAVRAGKRSAAQQTAISRHRSHEAEEEKAS